VIDPNFAKLIMFSSHIFSNDYCHRKIQTLKF